MALLLHIDTATENASICLSLHNKIIALEESFEQKNHACFIQPAIQKIFKENSYLLTDIDAIAVSAGPGSYTGLRVGLSTAKGLCYALDKPLLMVDTLLIMAAAARDEMKSKNLFKSNMIFCPMIDARRMEVFTGIYDEYLNTITPPHALIFSEDFNNDTYNNNIPVISGSGAIKAKNYIKNKNVCMSAAIHNACTMVPFSLHAYNNKIYCDLAYSEPTYVKPFFLR